MGIFGVTGGYNASAHFESNEKQQAFNALKSALESGVPDQMMAKIDDFQIICRNHNPELSLKVSDTYRNHIQPIVTESGSGNIPQAIAELQEIKDLL